MVASHMLFEVVIHKNHFWELPLGKLQRNRRQRQPLLHFNGFFVVLVRYVSDKKKKHGLVLMRFQIQSLAILHNFPQAPVESTKKTTSFTLFRCLNHSSQSQEYLPPPPKKGWFLVSIDGTQHLNRYSVQAAQRSIWCSILWWWTHAEHQIHHRPW